MSPPLFVVARSHPARKLERAFFPAAQQDLLPGRPQLDTHVEDATGLRAPRARRWCAVLLSLHSDPQTPHPSRHTRSSIELRLTVD